jgi:hypothetical protein
MWAGVLGDERSATASVASSVREESSSVSLGFGVAMMVCGFERGCWRLEVMGRRRYAANSILFSGWAGECSCHRNVVRKYEIHSAIEIKKGVT